MASFPLDKSAPPSPVSDTEDENENCEDCCGEDTGECDDHSSSSYSAHPVRYWSGEIRLVQRDLSSSGFGVPWGHTRSYSNRVTEPREGANGNGWFVKEWPRIANTTVSPTDPNEGTMSIFGIINDALWFDYDSASGGFIGKFFIMEELRHNGGAKEFSLTDLKGRETRFFDFSADHPESKRGQFKSYTDAFGAETTAQYDSGNRIVAFVQESGGTSNAYHYEYYEDGLNEGKLRFAIHMVEFPR